MTDMELVKACALAMIAFGSAGRVDMEEEQRLSMEGYIRDHARVTASIADVGTENMDSVRYAELRRVCP